MSDIKSPMLLYVKGTMILWIGVMGFALVILERPSLRIAALMAISIWGFCLACYFAFYVIQHYIDPNYRFASLTAFVGYLLESRRETDSENRRGQASLIGKATELL